MSPLRWDVLLVGFVLALPVVALGLRGDLTPEETMTRRPLVPGRGLGGGRRAAAGGRAAGADGEEEDRAADPPVARNRRRALPLL